MAEIFHCLSRTEKTPRNKCRSCICKLDTFLGLCGRRYMLLRNRWGRGELRPRWRRLQTSTTTSTVTLDTHEATLLSRGASTHTAVRGNPKFQTSVHHLTPATGHTTVNLVSAFLCTHFAIRSILSIVQTAFFMYEIGWNEQNVTFAWWPRVCQHPVRERGFDSGRGYREAGVHLGMLCHWHSRWSRIISPAQKSELCSLGGKTRHWPENSFFFLFLFFLLWKQQTPRKNGRKFLSIQLCIWGKISVTLYTRMHATVAKANILTHTLQLIMK